MQTPPIETPPSVGVASKRLPYGLVLAALVFIEMVAAFETSMIYAMLPKLLQVFADPIGVGWLLTGYSLVAAVLAALCSRLGDIYGRRRMLVIVLTMAALGSLVSALAGSLAWLIAGRALQGGVGAALPLLFGLARENITKDRLPLAISIISSAAGIGAGIGFLLGGMIVDHLTWQTLFWFSGTIAVLAITVALIVLSPSRPAPPQGPLDILGGVLFAPGIALLLIALSRGKYWGWLSTQTLGVAAMGLLLLVAWVRHERKVADPLIDVRLMAKAHIAVPNLALFLMAIGAMSHQIFTILLQTPTWTGVGLGLSATTAGLFTVPSIFASALGGAACGLLIKRYDGQRALVVGGVIISLSWLALWFDHSGVPQVVGLMLTSVLGINIASGAIVWLIVDAADASRTSEVTGVTQVVRYLGLAVGSQVVAVLMAHSTITNPAAGPGTFPDAAAFKSTFAYVAGLCCLMTIMGLRLRRPVLRVAA